jgi:muramoyltetrapeptide carboxypeptidase
MERGHRMFAPKLRAGDEIRVVSPATSLSYIAPDQPALAEARLGALGLRVTYAEHAWATELLDTGPVQLRLADPMPPSPIPASKGSSPPWAATTAVNSCRAWIST